MAGAWQLSDCTNLTFTLLPTSAHVTQEVTAATPVNLDVFAQISAAVNGFVMNFPLLEPVGKYLSAAGDAPFCAAPILRIYAASCAGFSRSTQAWDENVRPLLQEMGPSTEVFASLNDREKLYVQALDCCHRKAFRRAFDIYVELLQSFPTDLCAMIFMLSPCQFGVESWQGILGVYRDAQERAGWTEERLPTSFLMIRTFALNNAGLLSEALQEYERFVASEGGRVRTSHAVHIGAHVKTFTKPASEALQFLEEAAAKTGYFASGKREHLLMHLGALHGFNMNFSRALDMYDRLWEGSGMGDTVDRSSEEFQWNAVLLLWYIDISLCGNLAMSSVLEATKQKEALDRRWDLLAQLIEGSDKTREPIHGYWALLYAFALRRGGRSDASMVLISWVRSQEGRRVEVPEASEDEDIVRQWFHEHWSGLTMPLLDGCMVFADALQGASDHCTIAALAKEAALALRSASEESTLERLGVSDEQRLVFRMSFYAAVLLAGQSRAHQQREVHDMWDVCRAEILESASVRPLWKLESSWLQIGASFNAAVGGC